MSKNRKSENIKLKMLERIITVIVVICVIMIVGENIISSIQSKKFNKNGDTYAVEQKNMFTNYTNDSSNATVVFFSDIGEPSSAWLNIKNNLESGSMIKNQAFYVSTAVYDRFGYGNSDPIDSGVTIESEIQDINMMLQKGNYTQPYILVGDGYGGVLAKYFAKKYKNNVMGLVLINSLTDNTISSGEMKYSTNKLIGDYSKLDILSMFGFLNFDSIWEAFVDDRDYRNGLKGTDKNFYDYYIRQSKSIDAVKDEAKIIKNYNTKIDNKNFLGKIPVISLVSKYDGLYTVNHDEWLKIQKSEEKISDNMQIEDLDKDNYRIVFSDSKKIEDAIRQIAHEGYTGN